MAYVPELQTKGKYKGLTGYYDDKNIFRIDAPNPNFSKIVKGGKINQATGVFTPDDVKPTAEKLKTAIQNPTASTTPNTDGINFANLYSEYSGGNFDAMKQAAQASTQSLIDRIKQKIAVARQQYQPQRNNSEVQKAQELRSVLEQNANTGDRGGIGRQNALTTQTAGDNRLNAINLQEQNLVDQGELEKQSTINNSQAELLRNLIAEKNRQDDIAREDERYQNEQEWREREFDTDQDRYEDEKDRYESETETEQSRYEDETEYDRQQQAKEDFINTIGQYSGDYQAEINNIVNDGDTSNDWKLPYLKAARAQKLRDQLEANSKTADTEWQNAYKAWLQLTSGATAEMARILGIPKGTKARDVLETNYDIGKPYYKPGSGSSGGSDYTLTW